MTCMWLLFYHSQECSIRQFLYRLNYIRPNYTCVLLQVKHDKYDYNNVCDSVESTSLYRQSLLQRPIVTINRYCDITTYRCQISAGKFHILFTYGSLHKGWTQRSCKNFEFTFQVYNLMPLQEYIKHFPYQQK